MCLLFNLNDNVKAFSTTEESQAIYILSIVTIICSTLAFMCNPNDFKRVPFNYIFLFLFPTNIFKLLLKT